MLQKLKRAAERLPSWAQNTEDYSNLFRIQDADYGRCSRIAGAMKTPATSVRVLSTGRSGGQNKT